jgi:hypothetical protein
VAARARATVLPGLYMAVDGKPISHSTLGIDGASLCFPRGRAKNTTAACRDNEGPRRTQQLQWRSLQMIGVRQVPHGQMPHGNAATRHNSLAMWHRFPVIVVDKAYPTSNAYNAKEKMYEVWSDEKGKTVTGLPWNTETPHSQSGSASLVVTRQLRSASIAFRVSGRPAAPVTFSGNQIRH